MTPPARESAATPDDTEARGLTWLALIVAVSGIATGILGAAFRVCLNHAYALRSGINTWAHQWPLVGWVLPVAIAARGMLLCAASLGSCTRISPPRSFTALAPTAPSLPLPESSTAKASLCVWASDRKNRSMAARLSRGCSKAEAPTAVSLI